MDTAQTARFPRGSFSAIPQKRIRTKAAPLVGSGHSLGLDWHSRCTCDAARFCSQRKGGRERKVLGPSRRHL